MQAGRLLDDVRAGVAATALAAPDVVRVATTWNGDMALYGVVIVVGAEGAPVYVTKDRAAADHVADNLRDALRPLLTAARAEARAAALEEAVRECDAVEMHNRACFPRKSDGADDCARRIRAHAAPKPPTGEGGA